MDGRKGDIRIVRKRTATGRKKRQRTCEGMCCVEEGEKEK